MEPEFKEHLFEYEHNGSTWCIEVWATDMDDARARLRKLPHAKYLGELHARIPAVPGSGLYVRLMCWIRNLKQRIRGTA